jgi:hypothetical protein
VTLGKCERYPTPEDIRQFDSFFKLRVESDEPHEVINTYMDKYPNLRDIEHWKHMAGGGGCYQSVENSDDMCLVRWTVTKYCQLGTHIHGAPIHGQHREAIEEALNKGNAPRLNPRYQNTPYDLLADWNDPNREIVPRDSVLNQPCTFHYAHHDPRNWITALFKISMT